MLQAAAFVRAGVKKKTPFAGKHHRIFTVRLFSALPAPAILWLYFLSRLGFGQFFFSVASMRRKHMQYSTFLLQNSQDEQ
jgi:hypothetical protein